MWLVDWVTGDESVVLRDTKVVARSRGSWAQEREQKNSGRGWNLLNQDYRLCSVLESRRLI